METPRLQALRGLQNSLPVTNSRVLNQQKAARDLQLQQAVAKAPVATPTSTAATTGAALASSSADTTNKLSLQAGEQQKQVGALGLAERARAGQQALADQTLGLEQQKMGDVERLARVSQEAKQELYDAQMQFQKDEMGRTLFNERQLVDYAAKNARSNEEFQNYALRADKAHLRNLQAMETIYKKMDEELQFEYAKDKQKQDQAKVLQIKQIQKDMARKIAHARTRRGNNKAKWQAGGTIVGTVIGTVVGAVVGGKMAGVGAVPGAMAGGAIGGAAGGAIGGGIGEQV
jgi:hypothetical protein